MTADITEQRRIVLRRVKLAKRIGYGGLLLAIAAIGLSAISGFNSTLGIVMTIGLVLSILTLPVAVTIGYGLRAAAREDRQG